MKRMIEGSLYDIPDEKISSSIIRQMASIPADRPLVLQKPDGSNVMINDGEDVQISPEDHITHVPPARRG